MSVDARAHISGPSPLSVRRLTVNASGVSGCRSRRAVRLQEINNDWAATITLEDLGAALRILKIRPADLGYKP